MLITQAYELVNKTTSEMLGRENVLNEDLSNVVDVGKELFNANSVDAYVKSLVNRIGRTWFVDRQFTSIAPDIFMDGWEYGSVSMKIQAELPEASENESWELEDGSVYEQDMFYKPVVSAKFFNNRVTFEVPMSFTEMQVKQSFNSAQELGAFISMLYTAVENSMTLKIDSLAMRTINNFISATYKAEISSSVKTGIRAINLLELYNNEFNRTLTASACLKDTDFIKYASYTMNLYKKRLEKPSSLFNIGGKARFTPSDRLKIIMLDEFSSAANFYLQADTFNENFTRLPNAFTVPYWQGSGTQYDFANTSKIMVTNADNNTITVTGILCVMFDRWALGINNYNRRVTSHYNSKAEFFNNWYKMDAQYFNDYNENFIMFFVA